MASRAQYRHSHRIGNHRRRCYPALQSIPEDESSVARSREPVNLLPSPGSPTSIVLSSKPPLLSEKNHDCSSFSIGSAVNDASQFLVHCVNEERIVRGIQPFHSSDILNQLAMQHAKAMAALGSVYHSVSTIDELKLRLLASLCDEVAENVQRGDTVHGMHLETMDCGNVVNRSNVLSMCFTEYGCGVATGHDGKLYSCQLFRSYS